MTIGQTIKARRKRIGLHQYELAARLSVSQSTVADWENDVQRPRPNRLAALAKELKMSVSRLLGMWTADAQKAS